jgi:hypothetical protein
MQEQVTSNLIMIRPIRFCSNKQTAESNAFQNDVKVDENELQIAVQTSFDEFVEQLRLRDINVKVFEDTLEPHTPDSIFPNNWLSLHFSGKAILYPMEAENRRAERRTDILDYLKKDFDLDVILDFTHFEKEGKYLEGTGSLVFDRMHRVAYACLSTRTNQDVLKAWQKQMNGYEVVTFSANDRNGVPIYHTNVMMCMGETFCVICLDAITDLDERLKVKKKLEATSKEVIEITMDQMENFAGNMLLVKNASEKRFLIMSEKAHNSLTKAQIRNLEDKAEIIAVDLGYIETMGGGSARCMIAENLLVKK